MHTLVVQHVEASDPPRFIVIRHEPYQTAPGEKIVPSYIGFPIADAPKTDLRDELRWYLEEFLDYPFPPVTERAERVLDALKAWGTQAFLGLLNEGKARKFYDDATRDGLEQLQIRIIGNDPRILSWPWEALHDPEHGFLAHHCHIERQLTNVADPLPLPERLPQDRINILLVTARPFEDDVRYRSISRPLVELIHDRRLPAEVTLLRPPTLDQLDRVLGERPGYYHLVHFDGHGGYGQQNDNITAAAQLSQTSPHVFSGPQGCLAFETPEGKSHLVPASTLSALLKKHRIPAVVLNACQSATLDEHAEDAFASVAASLVRAGVRSVVAMAWSLYVSGAQRFLPTFYEQLFTHGNLADPTRAGRAAMLAHPGRVCARGEYPLADWVVPVVYQQQPADFSFAANAVKGGKTEPESSPLPEETGLDHLPFGFIGRDSAILTIERALHRRPPVILIHGLGGVGKTTLAAGLIRWLHQTGGLGQGCFWFTFRDIRTAEHVLNQIGIPLFGAEFTTLPNEQKVRDLARVLRESRFVLVWDNFESVHGNEAAGVAPIMPTRDRQLLLDLLGGLAGGQTKVIMTSRSDEPWLPVERRCRIELGGLRSEECWEFCSAILRNLGLEAKRENTDLVELMELLGGHPLLMRAVLPQLDRQTAKSIAEAIRQHKITLGSATDATLRFVEDGLPEELRPLLAPLALHERYVDGNLLEMMAGQIKSTGDRPPRAQIDRFLYALATAGLIQDCGHAIYELHPALSVFLRGSTRKHVSRDLADCWTRAFVDVLGYLANKLTPKQLCEQRFCFNVHQANFHEALAQARRLEMDWAVAALTQSLAAYALNTRDFDTAERMFAQLAEDCERRGYTEGESSAYHQLGMIAQERRDFTRAEQWYLKVLASDEKQGNERGAASTNHQLGMVAEERGDLAQAEQWYFKALAIWEKQGNEHGMAITYHQLGMVAQKCRDFTQAEQWSLKSLAIKETQSDEHGAACTYGLLGNLVLARRDFVQSEQWYIRALTIFEKQGDDHGVAQTYHQLGLVAQERGDLLQAEQRYLKSLAISEKQGDEHGAAQTYHELGLVAQERGDFVQAEQWYLKALATDEKQGNESGVANTYHQMGMIAQKCRDFTQAERWYCKALAIDEKQDNEHGAAVTYGQLGDLARLQGHFELAGRWLIRSIKSFRNCRDDHGAAQVAMNFAIACWHAPAKQTAIMREMWKQAGFGSLSEMNESNNKPKE